MGRQSNRPDMYKPLRVIEVCKGTIWAQISDPKNFQLGDKGLTQS